VKIKFIILILILGSTIGAMASDITEAPPNEARGSKIANIPEIDINNRQDCELLYWHSGTVGYYWPIPEPGPSYEANAFAVNYYIYDRFDLQGAYFVPYDAGDGTFGDDTIYVSVYDDFFGPNNLLGRVAVEPGTYNSLEYNYVDLTSLNISPVTNFFLGISTSATNDYENFISDDGSEHTFSRSFVLDDLGEWHNMGDYFGDNYEFFLDAEVCKPEAVYSEPVWIGATIHMKIYLDDGFTEPSEESFSVSGDAILGWDDWSQSSGDEFTFYNQIIDLNLSGQSDLLGQVVITLPLDLPISDGYASNPDGMSDFPAESFFDVFCEMQLPDSGYSYIHSDTMWPIKLESAHPIDSFPPYWEYYVNNMGTVPFVSRSGEGPYMIFITMDMTILPEALETCYSTTDINGDGIALSVADLLYLEQFVAGSGPPPQPLYQGDLNGDCIIDELDVDVFNCYIEQGMSCFPEYPIPTCCHPDVFRSACCFFYEDACRVLHVDNCSAAEGEFYYTGIYCNPDPCPCLCNPGDADEDENVNLLDITYMINFLYKEGPSPVIFPICSGDANCDCAVNLLDVTYLINFLYKEGAPPCSCEEWQTSCTP